MIKHGNCKINKIVTCHIYWNVPVCIYIKFGFHLIKNYKQYYSFFKNQFVILYTY